MRLHLPKPNGTHLIHDYVFKNELDEVRSLLKKIPDAIDSRDENGKTPLIVAACFNRCDVIDMLMTSSKCDINKQDIDGNTALHEAADRGYTDVVRKLMDSGRCDMNIRNHQGQTALMRAAMYDYIDIVRLILKTEKAVLNITDIHGQTALHIALQEGSHLTAIALISAGCDVSAVDNTGKSALYAAIHSPLMKSLEPAKHIVEAGCKLSIDKMWLLNEEKHNLFYQDDEFYVHLRQILRKNSSSEPQLNTSLHRQTSTLSSREGINPFPGTQRDGLLQRTNSSPPLSLSPMVKQKILTSKGFTNGISMDWTTPPGSPVRSRRSSSRSSLAGSSKSSFDSENGESQGCSSPSVFTYPSAHIGFHTLNRNNSESLDQNILSCRPDCIAEFTTHECTTNAEMNRMPNENTRNISVITVSKYNRQQSEKLPRNTKEKRCQRKISLPTKPSVSFNKEIQVIDIGSRR